jgi:hypothetical protein
LTLRTHELPASIGGVDATISATSDTAYRSLVGQMLSFYSQSLLNPYWGEQVYFGQGSTVTIAMVFQGLSQAQADQTWAPMVDWIKARPDDYTLTGLEVVAIPGQFYWGCGRVRALRSRRHHARPPPRRPGRLFLLGGRCCGCG